MNSLASLASSLGPSKIQSRAEGIGVVEIGDDGITAVGNPLGFQYFPETLVDSKQSNWRDINVPGGSLPLYQWSGSGERTISFEAVFTADVDVVGSDESELRSRLDGAGHGRRNPDIRTALVWLRRFMMPRYQSINTMQSGAPLTKPPRKLQLHMPGSGIGAAHGGLSGVHDGIDWITVIMRQCDVLWQHFFPSGQPHIVSVQLSFAQIAQTGSSVAFPSVTEELDKLVFGERNEMSENDKQTGMDSRLYTYKIRK